MRLANISEIEATMFIEYIRNYIGEQLEGFLEANGRDIERVSSGINLSVLLPKRQLCQTVGLHIVQPYIAFINKLVRDIDGKLCEFFGLQQIDLPPQIPDLFHYRLNGGLIAEYAGTETISEVMGKLINKTLDFSCLDRIRNPSVKKFIDPLSIGSLLMCAAGLDGITLKNRHRHELCRVLKGIGKNVNKRTIRFLTARYTAFIYQKTEEIQTFSSYEQAI